MTSIVHHHKTRLRRLAGERSRAQENLAAIEEELREAVIAADEAKVMTRREIAEVANCSPQSVYNWLGIEPV